MAAETGAPEEPETAEVAATDDTEEIAPVTEPAEAEPATPEPAVETPEAAEDAPAEAAEDEKPQEGAAE